MGKKKSNSTPEKNTKKTSDGYEDLLNTLSEDDAAKAEGKETAGGGDLMSELLDGIDTQDEHGEEENGLGTDFDKLNIKTLSDVQLGSLEAEAYDVIEKPAAQGGGTPTAARDMAEIDLGSFEDESGGDYTSIIGEIGGLSQAGPAKDEDESGEPASYEPGELTLEVEDTGVSYESFLDENPEKKESEEPSVPDEEVSTAPQPDEGASAVEEMEFSLGSLLGEEEAAGEPVTTEKPAAQEERIQAKTLEEAFSLDDLLTGEPEEAAGPAAVPAEDITPEIPAREVLYDVLVEETAAETTEEESEELAVIPAGELVLDETSDLSYDSLIGEEIGKGAGSGQPIDEKVLETGEEEGGYGDFLVEETGVTTGESEAVPEPEETAAAEETWTAGDETEFKLDLTEGAEEAVTGEFKAPEQESGIVIGGVGVEDEEEDFLKLDEEPVKKEDESLLAGIAGAKVAAPTEVLFEGIAMDVEEQIKAVTRAEMLIAQGKNKEAGVLLDSVVDKKGVTTRVRKLLENLKRS